MHPVKGMPRIVRDYFMTKLSGWMWVRTPPTTQNVNDSRGVLRELEDSMPQSAPSGMIERVPFRFRHLRETGMWPYIHATAYIHLHFD